MTFSIIRPVDVTAARLTATNVPEPATGADPDPAVWNAATAYATDAQVTRTTTHRIYQRVGASVAVVDASLPENSPTMWVDIGATNRWRQFDTAVDSQTSCNDAITGTVTPGARTDRIVFLNVDAKSIRVTVSGTSYDVTKVLTARVVEDWYDYFFEPFEQRTDVVFEDLPVRVGNVINYTISNPGGVARAGAVIVGLSKDIGGTEYGAEVGIEDFSVKETAQGRTTVLEGAYSKTMNVSLWVKATQFDATQRLLAGYRATAVVWVGAGDLYGALIVYGFYRSFRQVLPYPTWTKCNLEIEGLT